jgi:hypothetical protein
MATKSVMGGLMQLIAARLSEGESAFTYVTAEDVRKRKAAEAKRKAEAKRRRRRR